MDSYEIMRYFTNAAQNYVLHYSDYYASEVEKCLRTVDSLGDYSNFMQSSNASVQFYVSLHEYLQNLQSQSPGVWFAVSFLRKISNNRCFINDLVTSFRFIPVLSKFLGIQNNEEDLLNLLTLLSNLTYGIHVSWQDSYLPDMLFTLSDILLESPSVDLKSKSLMVISNLCYKNPAALHILISKVPTNKFIKCITALNCDGSVQLQVLKMLVIFEEMKGQLPDCEILNFADVAFNCIISAFQKTDAYALQQVVDFFTDINDNPSKHEVLKNYPKTLEDTKKLLDLIEGAPVNEDSVEACVGILFSFLPTIFKLRIKKTTQLFPRLFKVSTPWIDREKTCVQVLNVLRMTVVVLKDSTIIDQDTIINLGIITVLPHLITRFKSIKDQKTLSPLELAEISVLVSLLGELLSSNEVIRSQITDAIDTNTLHQIVENVVKKKEVECNALIIDIVSFVHTMTVFNEEWTDAFKSYLSNQHVLAAISLSLSQDSKQTKMKALSLLSSTLWDDGARKRLCECLVNKPNVSSSNNVCAEIVPSVFVYESRVSELLSNLDGQMKPSAVMELYEYKLAAVEHSNKRLLDAANAKSNALHHQIAEMQEENRRFRQALLNSQQTNEGLSIEKAEYMNQLDNISNQRATEKATMSQIIKEVEAQNNELMAKLKSREHTIEILKAKEVELEATRKAKVEVEEELAQCRADHEAVVAEYETKLTESQARIDHLELIREAILKVAEKRD